MSNNNRSTPTLFESILPIVFLIGFLSLNVIVFGDDSSYGPNQMALIFSAGVAGLIALNIKIKWETIINGVNKNIITAMPAILILLLIGALTGTWKLSGIVPSMVYYGLNIIHPSIFLFAACFISILVSLATGSSWTTVATIGVALFGIGRVLGFGNGIIAGAIISGAYFGDKMSPLSDTTNLAPAVSGTNLYTHIKYMSYTTIPSIIITLLLFLVIGFWSNSQYNVEDIKKIQEVIDSKYHISPILFVVPAVVIFLILKKVETIPVLIVAILMGLVFAFIFQIDTIYSLFDNEKSYFQNMVIIGLKSMYGEINMGVSEFDLDKLLNSGGMYNMLNTVWLIICAMAFGGVMMATGMLNRITNALMSLVKSDASLIATTSGTCVFFNATASDQYISIVVPGKMFAQAYKDKNLAPENLSRTLEDSGTVTSVLVPWNTCAQYHSSTLSVSPEAFIPYCFFNIISPIMTIAYAYLKIKIRKIA